MAVIDAIGNHNYVRVPPDGTGKRTSTQTIIAVEYGSGTIAFTANSTVVGATNGAFGTILRIEGTTTTGTIFVLLDATSTVVAFEVSEPLQVNAVTNAVVVSSADIHTAVNVAAGGNNPLHHQFIDNRGNAFVRFAEGEQQMDAFGLSRTTAPVQLAQYIHDHDTLPMEFQTVITGVGSDVLYSSAAKTVFMDVDAVSGSEIQRTTNRYHRYTAGQGTNVTMTVATGDSGKANVTRRWGFFDDDNGIFFEMSGSDMNIVLRTSSDGTLSETRVAQTDWNTDRLDGSSNILNLSKMTLAPDAINIYWIDFAWLGAGRVRCGVFEPSGDRVICHSFLNSNNGVLPYMGTGVLPLRFLIRNTETSASPSRLSFTCASVHTDGAIVPDLERRSTKFLSGTITPKACPPGVSTPLITIRSAAEIDNITNRLQSIPEELSVYVSGSPVSLCIHKNAILNTSSYIQAIATDLVNVVSSGVEVDTSATSYTDGFHLIAWFASEGEFSRKFPGNFNLKGESLYLHADGGSAEASYTLAVKPVNNVTASVSFFLNWIDLG